MAGPWEKYQQAAPVSDGPWTKYQEKPAEKPGVIEDVAKTIPSGLARGVAGVVGLPGDLRGAVNKFIVDPIADWALGPTNTPKPAIPGDFPTSAGVVKTIEGATGPLYKPQTVPGEYVNTIAEFAPGALFGGGTVAQRAAQVVVPAVTSETAGQVARKVAPEWEGTARAVGAIGGAIGTTIAQTPRGANAVMQDALGGATRQELEAAYQLMDQAAALPGGGVQLTLNEALNQVTNGRFNRLQQLDRVVTNSGGAGAERMAEVYSARPEQIRQTGRAAVDSLAPNPYLPEQAAQRGQESAQGALRTVRGERAAITDPFYTNAARDAVPAQEVQGVIQRLDDIIANAPTPELAEAAQQLRGQLILHPATPGTPATRTPVVDPRTGRVIRYDATPATPGTPEVPRTNVGELDNVYGQARDDFMGPPVVGETGSQVRARRAAGGAIAPLNDALEAASPNLVQGRAAHQQVTRNLVQPVEQGPIGRIAEIDPGSANASAQMGRELAAPGIDRYHGVVQQSVRRMVRQDPRAAETLARDYVGDVLNTATRDLQGGPNVYGGAAFFKKIAGDEASLQNLQAMVTQLPQGQQRWAGFQRFLDTMQATGYKAAKGSDTAFNQAMQQQMREGGVIGRAVETGAGAGAGAVFGGGAGSAAGGAIALRQALSDRLARWRMGNAGDQVAWMLTSREAAPLLRQLANAPAGSGRANALSLRLMVLGERGANSGNLPAQPVP